MHGRDFATGAQLWEYLQSFDADNSDDAAWERYMEFHAWKKGGMDAFMRVRVCACLACTTPLSFLSPSAT